MTEPSLDSDAYYQSLFTQSKLWSKRYPNRDEILRAHHIMQVLTGIVNKHHKDFENPPSILDVGSGRGWLSQLLTMYGQIQGVEPVADVVEHARLVYPHIEFTIGTPQSLVEKKLHAHFDLIVSSEVLEHVPFSEQAAFMQAIADLLKSGGRAVITTPRGEIQDIWLDTFPASKQPVEDWVTETQLQQLAIECGFQIEKHSRFGLFYDLLRKSLLNRLLLKLIKTLGYQYAEPARFSVYQLVVLQKR